MIHTSLSTLCKVDIFALLALFHPFGFFCLFASLHACLHVHARVYVSSTHQSNGTMDTRSKPTFVLLGHHLLFDNMFVCLFAHFTCFVCPLLALFVSVFFACSPYLLCSFLCLSAGLFFFVFACTCTEHGHLEQGYDLLGASKNGKDESKKMEAHKRQHLLD